MEKADQNFNAAQAIRDFFIADNSKAMEEAYLLLDKSMDSTLPDAGNLDELEYSFNKLFVGPKALEAPPFASVYLQKEPNLMGETTMMIRSVYKSLGLVSPWKNSLPDDHISLEIDAALVMRRLMNNNDLPELLELGNYFIKEHMLTWVPLFCHRVQKAPSGHIAVNSVAAALCKWLEQEADEYTESKEIRQQYNKE